MKQANHRVSAIAGTVAICLFSALATAATVTFETVPLGGAGYDNGSGGAGGFSLGGANFNNNYDSLYGSWSGFAISNQGDTVNPSYLNQYSAWPGGGVDGSAQFAAGYFSTYQTPSTTVAFDALTNLAGLGASFANTTYAALSMRDGDAFSKKFGGASGSDPDYLRLSIEGFAGGIPTTTVDFYLADYRFGNPADDFIADGWNFVDFTALGVVDELRFSVISTDAGTPTYFAMDNFLSVPEPSPLLIFVCGAALLLRRNRRIS